MVLFLCYWLGLFLIEQYYRLCFRLMVRPNVLRWYRRLCSLNPHFFLQIKESAETQGNTFHISHEQRIVDV